MKVLTKYPVYINRKKVSGADLYMNFDANGKPTNKAEIIQFQKWLVAKGVDISFKNKDGKIISGKDAIDGDMRAGSVTAKAWDNYGAEFAKTLSSSTPTTATPTTPTATEPTQQQKDEAAKKRS